MAIFEEVELQATVSKDASFNTSSIQLKNQGYAVQIDWAKTAGTLAGSVKLQGRVSPNLSWADVADSSVNLTDGSSSQLWNAANQSYNYLRIAVTISSGTGNFTAYLSSKDN